MVRLLILTDMLGRATHGLAQAPAYLDQLARGVMNAGGERCWLSRKET